MKKRLLTFVLCLTVLLGLTGCFASKDEGDTALNNKYVDLEIVQDISSGGIYGRILVDRYTGVLYLWYKDNAQYGQTITPLYNANGSLKNITDFEQ